MNNQATLTTNSNSKPEPRLPEHDTAMTVRIGEWAGSPAAKPPVAQDIVNSYEGYGCKLNAIAPEDLFRQYQRAGFLYPSKMQKLAPHLPAVMENWRRGLRGGELIHYVVTYDDPQTGAWGSVSSWRSTHGGWNPQHLVSMGSPAASRAVMLAPQAVRIHDGFDFSQQNWFRPDNRYANKVFGSLVETIGPEASAVGCYQYIAMPLRSCAPAEADYRVIECENEKCPALFELASQVRGTLFAKAEELDHKDLLLEEVDELYRKVGLRRYRRIWLAFRRGTNTPIGAAIAWRGPLGFNFSFIENRCDLLLMPGLDSAEAQSATAALMHAAASAYEDFALGAIPVVADQQTASVLLAMGGSFIRHYNQSIWLKQGFVGWYRHLEKFYERMLRAEKRHGLGHRQSENVLQPVC